MPELPEVEITRQSFGPRIRGARVEAVRLGKPLRWPLGCAAEALVAQTVGETVRRGKYLWLPLDRGGLLIHLGMSGSLHFSAHALPPPGAHDHFDLITSRGTLRLTDPRRFGAVLWSADLAAAPAAKLLGGLGMRLTLDKQNEYARELLAGFEKELGADLVSAILKADQSTEAGIEEQRERVAALKAKLGNSQDSRARDLVSIADSLVKRSVWIIGGDGWAYDIGYGGLDHVLASGRNVNILVLDTEVYSNTGGQASKSTPRAAVAKFAMGGKGLPKKDLGLIAMSYGYVYVARVAMGANDQQTLRAFLEAEAYDGPSLIIAYSHCIAHGYDMAKGLEQQKLAVQSGHWPMYRYDPRMAEKGQNPLLIESKEPTIPVSQYAYNETRYRMLTQMDEARAEKLMAEAQHDAKARWTLYQQMAAMHYNGSDNKES